MSAGRLAWTIGRLARRLLWTAALAWPVAFAAAVPDTPAEHRRPADQTFLTYPEWYLVHSPAEYADWLGANGQPSRFPLFSHVGQFWQSYAAVTHEVRDQPLNGGYHLMVMVIGSSTTVEYGIKGAYEHTVGRLAEGARGDAPVPEERFAAAYAQDYVDFIRYQPWYKFDFLSRLKALWRDVPLGGPDRIRRWERRYLLTTELLIKEGYARLIKLGSESVYEEPNPVTAVVLDRAPTQDPPHPEYRVLAASVTSSEDAVLATIPRYEGFTVYSQWLARQGCDFRAIAGNYGEIVISVLAPRPWRPATTRELFEQPILTRPGVRRLVLAVPIARLGDVLRAAAGEGIRVEHVYDF